MGTLRFPARRIAGNKIYNANNVDNEEWQPLYNQTTAVLNRWTG